MLASVSSSSWLEHVHLRIRAGGAEYHDLLKLDWARVAETLAGARFRALRRLTFEIIRGDSVKHTIVPLIRKMVAGLENKNRHLSVRYVQRL